MEENKITICEMTSEQYAALLASKDVDCFLTPAFNEVNSHKVDEIKYLVFERRGNVLGGIILGRKGDWLFSPFSAPYGGLLVKKARSVVTLQEMAEALKLYLHFNKYNFQIIFPSNINNDVLGCCNVYFELLLQQLNFKITKRDINLHIDLDKNVIYPNDIRRRNALAEEDGLVFHAESFDKSLFERVYSVIEANHFALGYRMAMSREDYLRTSAVLPMTLFSVEKEGVTLAGGICYDTRPGISQLIAWGDDLSARRKVSPMPFLAVGMIAWYREFRPDVKVLDLGPSSTDGKVTAGLCDFKRSIGGMPTIKTTLIYIHNGK